MKEKIPLAIFGSLLIGCVLLIFYSRIPKTSTAMYIYTATIVSFYFSLLYSIANYLDSFESRKIVMPIVLFSVATFILVLAFGYAWMVFGNFASTTTTKSPTGIDAIYFSGITFFTIGYGDYTPNTDSGKILSLIEALLGATHMAAFFTILLSSAIQKPKVLSIPCASP